ncbi:MAG: triose-phosphate isomerase [Patescibacteria group bacterium]
MSVSKPVYLFANWKMYLDFDESNILANALANESKNFPKNVKMAIFPSALALYPVGQVLADVGIGLGAQNTYWVDKGGYTGEISAQMYKDAGCSYALAGHSERRHQFHESNHETREKLEAILAAGMTAVLCVGETAAEREKGQTDEAVEVQLRAAFDNLTWPEGKNLFIAYEPVWAIGTGKNCDAKEAQRMHALIKKLVSGLVTGVNPIILYGGSVRPENVDEYLGQPDIAGVLVGGASAKLDSWLGIVNKV